MKRHPFAVAFSPKRMAQPDSNVRRAPTPPKKKAAVIPAAPTSVPAAKPARWANETPRFADDLLIGAVSHLLRHEYDGQSVEDHDVSGSVLDCVLALCEFYEEQIPPQPSEEIQYKAGQILRLLEVSAECGESVHELMTATELSADDVLLAVAFLKNCGVKIRSEMSYESRYLELVFVLDAHQVRQMRGMR
jgi:hypothetical protein